MLRMIEIEGGGYVNLAQVARSTPLIRTLRDRRDGTFRYELRNAVGDILGILVTNDIHRVLATYLPASAEQTAYLISVDRADGQRPTEADVSAFAQPVIAWQFNNRAWNQTVFPVLVDVASNQDVWCCMPDGTLQGGDMIVANLTEAKAACLEEAQSNWDAEHRRRMNSDASAA